MSPTLTLNGRKLPFREGQTVLEVARENQVYIPSLCYHSKTGPASRCRVCVVEVEGLPGLQTACTLTAEAGMKVDSESPQVQEVRRMLIELLLAEGEHDCLSCEANGRCELQDAAYYLGIEKPAFTFTDAHAAHADEAGLVDDSSEMIVIDHRRCIKCGRCIAGDNQTVVNEVLDFGYRGHRTRVICDDDLPMGSSSCVQCGECVQLCPVGAIIDKKSRGRGRPWELKTVDTVCPYCGVGCQIRLHINEAKNEIVRVTGIEGSPTNDGMLCVKGRYAYEFVASPERLRTPLIRGPEGELRPAGWEEAINLVASRFREIARKHGPDAVAGLSSAKCTNEENYAFQKLMRREVGTNNVDHCARL